MSLRGAGRGIGLELVRQAIERGHSVLAVARSSKNLPAGVKVVETDLTETGAAEKITETAAAMGHVDVLINSFHINSVVPFQVTKALRPLLRKSGNPKVVQMTSLMGSIADNGSGGYYSYRASKAALNMINKSLAKDYDWLTTVVVHPGWVKTDMGGPEAPTEVRESAAGIFLISTDGNFLGNDRTYVRFREIWTRVKALNSR